jgi:Domain of unknown function (DUF4253)
MERAMSLAAVPDGSVHIAGTGVLQRGRQLRTESGVPVAWISDETFGMAGLIWTCVSEESAESGLQPFLLAGMTREPGRPWDTGEDIGDPENTTAIDRMDAARLLEDWWDIKVPTEDEFAEDEDLREIIAPFGLQFPGLAPAVEEELDPELMRRAVCQYTRDARIGLVPAARPADILPRLGWRSDLGTTASELGAVLRSWEDRFGARLLEVGFAEIRLLVTRPPLTLEVAQRLAAEHFAFADEAHIALGRVDDIARAVVNNPFWDFWWD